MYVLIDIRSIQKQITEPVISGGLVLIHCNILDLQYIHRCRLQHTSFLLVRHCTVQLSWFLLSHTVRSLCLVDYY
jgi:hypothetical protein